MSAVQVVTMTEADASRLTERIRVTAHNYAEARQKLQELVAEAKEGNAHLALGYASWTAYLADVLGEEPMRLARGERQEMVQMLSAEGMSTRAIAPIVGASVGQVHEDRQVFRNEQLVDEPSVSHGMDGKTRVHQPRTDPEPSDPAAPKRKPLTDQFFTAAYDLARNVERVERLVEDDRFPRNKNQVASKHRSDLIRTAETLTRVISKLN